jgi:hypothetical protein
MTIALPAWAAPASAASFTIYIYQDGANVDALGTGSIDLNTLGSPATTPGGNSDFVQPGRGYIDLGAFTADGSSDEYLVPNPGSFGTLDQYENANSGTGDLFLLYAPVNGSKELFLPAGYSGGPLSDTAVWDNTTLAGLALAPGTYQSSWDNGNGNLAIEVGVTAPAPATAPEPSGFSEIAMLGCLGLWMFRNRS